MQSQQMGGSLQPNAVAYQTAGVGGNMGGKVGGGKRQGYGGGKKGQGGGGGQGGGMADGGLNDGKSGNH